MHVDAQHEHRAERLRIEQHLDEQRTAQDGVAHQEIDVEERCLDAPLPPPENDEQRKAGGHARVARGGKAQNRAADREQEHGEHDEKRARQMHCARWRPPPGRGKQQLNREVPEQH